MKTRLEKKRRNYIQKCSNMGHFAERQALAIMKSLNVRFWSTSRYIMIDTHTHTCIHTVVLQCVLKMSRRKRKMAGISTG